MSIRQRRDQVPSQREKGTFKINIGNKKEADVKVKSEPVKSVITEFKPVKPGITDRKPVVTDVKPVVTDVKPVVTDVKPIVTDVKPVVTDVKPIVTDVKPIVTDVKPIVTDVKPIVTDVKPVITDVKSVVTEVKSTVPEEKTAADVQKEAEQTNADEKQEKTEHKRGKADILHLKSFAKRSKKNAASDEDDKDKRVKSAIAEAKPVVAEIKPVITEVKTVEAKVKRVSEKEETSSDAAETPTPKELEKQEQEQVDKLLERKNAFFADKKRLKAKKSVNIKEFLIDKKDDVVDFFRQDHDIKGFLQDKWKAFREVRLEKGEKSESDEMLNLKAKILIEENKNQIRIVAIGIALLSLIVIFGAYSQLRVYHKYKVLTTQERSDDNATQYVSLKNYRLKCNPNGVTCVNRKDEVQWNTTFTMESLIVEKVGSLAAVANQRGNEVYVFNEKGPIGSFTVEHPLTKMKLTKQGDIALVMEDGEVTWINVYDKNGTLLVKNKTTMSESGYPVDMDISDNGYKMMVSFLGVDEDIESRVAFYNFSAVGQDSEGKKVNEEIYKGHVVPEVKFMDGNYAIAFRDDGVTIFRGQQIPEEWNTVEIDQEIISAFSDDQYFGLIMKNTNEKEDHKYMMAVYRENGARCGVAYFDFEYTDIAMDNNRIALYNSKSMQIYDISGKLKYAADYKKPIVEVIPTTSPKKFNVVTLDSVDLIKIK